jgi:hypothetical protein
MNMLMKVMQTLCSAEGPGEDQCCIVVYKTAA